MSEKNEVLFCSIQNVSFLKKSIITIIFVLSIFSNIVYSKKALVSYRVLAFYYAWYANPYFEDGTIKGSSGWGNWDDVGRPPANIYANFYPVLGAYDSRSEFVIRKHCEWLVDAHIGGVIFSWWGQGTYTDGVLNKFMEIAREYGIKVAFIMEPYGGITLDKFKDDLLYLYRKWNSHPSVYKYKGKMCFFTFEMGRALSGTLGKKSLSIRDFSLYGDILAKARDDGFEGWVFAQTTDATLLKWFDGLSQYDGVGYAKNHKQVFPSINSTVYAANKIFAPSISPGFDHTKLGGTHVIDRENGKVYDRYWETIVKYCSPKPHLVTITSFNEWGEGSQIEPTSSNPPKGFGYKTFEEKENNESKETRYFRQPAYWMDKYKNNKMNEYYYIKRTAYWVKKYDSVLVDVSNLPGNKARRK